MASLQPKGRGEDTHHAMRPLGNRDGLGRTLSKSPSTDISGSQAREMPVPFKSRRRISPLGALVMFVETVQSRGAAEHHPFLLGSEAGATAIAQATARQVPNSKRFDLRLISNSSK